MENSLNSFVNYLIENKKLQFPAGEIKLDPFLFEDKVIKIENNNVIINNFEIVSKYFVESYAQKLNYSVGQDFEKNIAFINDVENDFNNNVFSDDYLTLEKEIWKYIIKESANQFKCSISEYLSSLSYDKKPDSFYNFVEAYGLVLPALDLTEDEIIKNFYIIFELTKTEGLYNVDLDYVLNGIRELCKTRYEFGLSILKKTINNFKREDILITSIVAGLYENKGIEFYESILLHLLNYKKNRNPILSGLSNVNEITDLDCKLFVKLFNQFKKEDTLIQSILALIFAILGSKYENYHQFCFKELELAIENENSAYCILHHMNYLENYKVQKTDIILKLINQSYFSIDKYIVPITRAIKKMKEFHLLQVVITSIINIYPFVNFIKKSKITLSNIDPVELDIFMINLLTDNTASKRFIGLEIFQELSRRKPYCFAYNILELPSITQYKLWMSLTVDFHQPKDRLISLLPLLDSKSWLVRESFLCKLEEITEDYSGSVLQILESNLDNDKPFYRNIINRIKNYIESFHNVHTVAKNSLQELNPYTTHYKQIQKFNDLFHKNMNRAINKGTMENSFLSLLDANTVQLAKGGGYRFGAKKEISQLSSFGTSLIMPRSYFINPNQYELEKGVEIRRNWSDDEFTDIIKILADE